VLEDFGFDIEYQDYLLKKYSNPTFLRIL